MTSDCLAIVSEPARRLWERRPSDSDFMELRVGEGDMPSNVSLRAPKQQLTLEEDTLAARPQQIAERNRIVHQCPVTYNAVRHPTCGLIGEHRACITLAKNLILQAATHHSYEDLRIVTVCVKEDLRDWEFVKWLPHSFDDADSERYIVDSPAAATRVFSGLEEILAQRGKTEDYSRRSVSAKTPYYLFICADSSLTERRSIMKYLVSNESDYGVGALFIYDDLDRLPKECNVILETTGRKGVIYHQNNTSGRVEFTVDAVREENYEAFARALAPIRIEAAAGKQVNPEQLRAEGGRVKNMAEQHGEILSERNSDWWFSATKWLRFRILPPIVTTLPQRLIK